MGISALKSYRILIVDDEKSMREVISQMARYAGFECMTAADGDEALQLLRSVSVDVMVTDIVMPRMDGIQLTLEAKKEFNVGVIVMTGYAKDYSFEQIIEKGADDFIEKPVRANELIVRLKRLIREREILNDRNKAELMLRESENRLRALTVRLQEVEEDLRKEIARELHDRMGQNLTALNLNLSIIKNHLSNDCLKRVGTTLSDSMKLVVDATSHMRDVMAMLRPVGLDEYGLAAAIRWYGKSFSARTGISVEVIADENFDRLPLSTETELFRIAQEAFTNILKHADADQVKVLYRGLNGRVRLVISDNGDGFDPDSVSLGADKIGWGMLLMKERARSVGAKLKVRSKSGEGTIIEVEAPTKTEQEMR